MTSPKLPRSSSCIRAAADALRGDGSLRACVAFAIMAGLFGAVGGTAMAQAATASKGKGKTTARPARAGTVSSAYYYNGKQRVELDLALDELELETDTPVEALSRAKAAGVAASVASSAHGRGVRVRLATPAGDRAGLKAAARRLADATGVRDVRAVAYLAGAEATAENRRILSPRLAVKVVAGYDAAQLAARHGLKVAKQVAFSPNTFVLTAEGDDPLAALEAANTLFETEYVEFSTPVIARQRFRRAAPVDPLFTSQWHLLNTGAPQQFNGVAGNDVNTMPAWEAGFTGAGVTIGVTDDGLQMNHPDLAPNVRADLSIDLNYGDNDPSPRADDPITTYTGGQTNPWLYDNHGTAVAGVAAAARNNTLGGVGSAYGAGLAGIRLISSFTTDELEAEAMLHKFNSAAPADRIHINTNSWGPSDNGYTLEGPGPLTKAALAHGAEVGRGGRGTIYTWAAGNGLLNNDNVNFDGYANNQHTIAVGATYADGKVSYYSEPGSAMMVNACSDQRISSAYYGIVTTDRTGSQGYTSGDYTPASGTATFGGTSAAAPLAAGCIALMLEANPGLSWRDVQQILVQTSTKNDPTDAGWVTNSAGHHFNHKYGFGRINAGAAVEAARTWTPLAPRLAPVTNTASTPVAIPDNNIQGVSQTLTLSSPAGFRAEHVEVTVDATHTYRGDLEFFLTSPSGTVAKLAGIRGGDDGDGFNNWTFLSLPSWGENPTGTWTLRVADRYAVDLGTLNSWTIKVHGTVPQSGLNNDFVTAAGWESFGAESPLASATFDPARQALLAQVAAGNENRIVGWRATDPAVMLPHSAAGLNGIIRAKFAVYAGGQAEANSNQIPNFRLRASTRFAATSILDVLHHSSSDLDGDRFGRDLRPSKNPAAPSIYRVDYAPVNVPLLHAGGSQEAVSLGFEAYSLASEPQENGFLALTETSLMTYPAPSLAGPGALIKTYASTADFSNSFYYLTARLNKAALNSGDTTNTLESANVNGSPMAAPGGGFYPLLSSSEVMASVSAAGVTLDTSNLGGRFVGLAVADFLNGNAEDVQFSNRARIEPGKQYHIRFHATANQPASTNALIRFRARTAKFQWTQRLEVGGSYAAGPQNNALARQMLPGTGSQNPDKIVGGEAGGWYTVVMHTPLSTEIRAEAAPTTPLTTSMPWLANEAGPGVNSSSRRDILVGLDLIDTLSNGPGHGLERGNVTVDRIEIRQYDLTAD